MKPPVRPKQSVGNVEQSETARRVSIFLMRINPAPKKVIFANLRTLEPKNPYFSTPVLWEPQTTIPEKQIYGELLKSRTILQKYRAIFLSYHLFSYIFF